MRIHFNPLDVTKWHRWFAWHPVLVGDSIVWLETVERREVPSSWDPYWEYR